MTRIQTAVAALLLLAGIGFLAWHFHHEAACSALDGDAKVGAGLVAAGLFFFPFGPDTAGKAVALFRQVRGNGGAGNPSEPKP